MPGVDDTGVVAHLQHGLLDVPMHTFVCIAVHCNLVEMTNRTSGLGQRRLCSLCPALPGFCFGTQAPHTGRSHPWSCTTATWSLDTTLGEGAALGGDPCREVCTAMSHSTLGRHWDGSRGDRFSPRSRGHVRDVDSRLPPERPLHEWQMAWTHAGDQHFILLG